MNPPALHPDNGRKKRRLEDTRYTKCNQITSVLAVGVQVITGIEGPKRSGFWPFCREDLLPTFCATGKLDILMEQTRPIP